jgi:pSer/pThr/pTyr-binding forkhead associated (FHA) protein
MFRVTMQFGGKAIRKYTFDKEVIAIGRDNSCDIVIENIGASRRHATIETTEDGYVLADLKSHNGTFVEGEKVFHHLLKDADEFFIGKYCFLFEMLEPVVEAETDGVDEAKQAANGGGGSGGGAGPDMTFRLDRKEIERIMGHSARGSQPQLVQLAPETEKRTVHLDKAYYVLGKDDCAEIKVAGFLVPAKAAVLIRGDHGWRVIAVSKRFQLNGKHVADGPLADGDLLQLGARRFRFCQA